MMNVKNLIAIVLIVAGVAGLVYGQFSYTKATHDIGVGSVQFALKEKETVNVPQWAGVAAIAAGVILLLLGRKK